MALVINATTWPLYPGNEPGPFWTGSKYLSPTGIRSPDRPARSESPKVHFMKYNLKIIKQS